LCIRKSKFTDSQIMDAVKRVEAGFAVPDICRELGISTATFYKWRAKYGGMDVSMMSRMKELEGENRRLKKMCIDPALSAQIKLLKHKPRQGSSCSAPDEGAGGYRSRSNPRSHGWRAAA
jgi:putative transposase